MSSPTMSLREALRSARVFTDGDWVESKDQDVDGDVRLVQLADVGDGVFIDKSSRHLTSARATELRCTFLDEGDILIARMPDPLGRACIFPGSAGPSVTVVDVCIVRPHLDEHDPRWLMHCLNSPVMRRQVANYATGSTRSRISRGNLAKVRITVPPLGEQRRIAAILDQADALRAKRREALAHLDDLTQSVFREMFGDLGSETQSRELIPLGDLCTRITDGTHQSPSWSPDGHPFLFVSNIVSGEIDFDTTKFISDQTYRLLTARCPIEIGDVLYSTVGSYGVPALVRTNEKFAFQRHIAHIKPNRDLLEPEFLRVMLATPGVRRQADTAARGVAQKTVNLADIKKFSVVAPPIVRQHEFVDLISKIRDLQQMHHAHVAEAHDLFGALQSRAFAGEL
jgi:type I restriction enzyme S subunit